MEKIDLKKIGSISHLLSLSHKIWIDYDEEADVLYVNFKKPSHADDAQLLDNDVIVRYEKGSIVGITILNAKKREILKE